MAINRQYLEEVEQMFQQKPKDDYWGQIEAQIRGESPIIPENTQSTPSFGIPEEDFYSQIDELKDQPIPKILTAIDKHPDITDKPKAKEEAISRLSTLHGITSPFTKFGSQLKDIATGKSEITQKNPQEEARAEKVNKMFEGMKGTAQAIMTTLNLPADVTTEQMAKSDNPLVKSLAPYAGFLVAALTPMPGDDELAIKKLAEKGISKLTGKEVLKTAEKDLVKGEIPKTTLTQEAQKYKSAEEFVKAQTNTSGWSELQKTNPELWNTGILRRDIQPYGAKEPIPADVHTAQGKWQNYGQYDEVPAKTIYKRIESGSFKGEYEDKLGNPVRGKDGDSILQDVYDDATGSWIEPTISNKQLKDNLLESFSTKEGKDYLNKVITALPKNPDGSITAYRIGSIGEGPQSYTLSEGMAKTFSNQGTDILPAGTPGLPKGGYKDFGALPVNTVKVDPKGIKAWNPYDAEILVESKYVQTKSQLTDIWNQANKNSGNISLKTILGTGAALGAGVVGFDALSRIIKSHDMKGQLENARKMSSEDIMKATNEVELAKIYADVQTLGENIKSKADEEKYNDLKKLLEIQYRKITQ